MAKDQHDEEIGAIAAGANSVLSRARERAHLIDALLTAIDRNDRVTALISASESAATAESALMNELRIDRIQARAVLGLQYRKLARLERNQLAEEYQTLISQIGEYEAIVNSPPLQRKLVGTDLGIRLAEYGKAID